MLNLYLNTIFALLLIYLFDGIGEELKQTFNLYFAFTFQ